MMLIIVILLALIFLAFASHPLIARNLPGVLAAVLGVALLGACLYLVIAGGIIFVVLYPDTASYIVMRIVRPILVWGGSALLAIYAVIAIWDRRRNGPMTQLAEKEKALEESLRAWRARERLHH